MRCVEQPHRPLRIQLTRKHLLEIAHALSLNHHTVKWHIKKMYMAELVDGDTSNSAYPVYYPTEMGNSSLHHFNHHMKKVVNA